MNNIAIYAEGGIGDCLLAHHKTWILKETVYPKAEFSIFLDTENNLLQARVLQYLFPDFYKEVFTIPSKKYKKLVINSQFGEEEVKGFYDNVPDDWKQKMESYDKLYNFHIDSLKFLEYPELKWMQYFKQFPQPKIQCNNLIGNYILSNIYSETGTEHVVDDWWANRLILEIDQLAKKLNYQHIIVSTPKLNDKYKEVMLKCSNTHLLNTYVEQVCDTISNCKLFIGIDSAWRLISHFFNKPTITLSKNCQGRGNVPVSHYLRWLPFRETTFGLYHPTQEVVKLGEKLLENQLYQVAPELSLTDNVNNAIIKREYKINEEKSILNENSN